jgi:hypothetical protein
VGILLRACELLDLAGEETSDCVNTSHSGCRFLARFVLFMASDASADTALGVSSFLLPATLGVSCSSLPEESATGRSGIATGTTCGDLRVPSDSDSDAQYNGLVDSYTGFLMTALPFFLAIFSVISKGTTGFGGGFLKDALHHRHYQQSQWEEKKSSQC